MLNDLAEAMKALEGKKSRHSCNRYPEGGTSTPRYKLDQSTTRDNPRGREGKEDGERNQNKGGQTTTEATGPTQAQRGTQQKPGGQREAPTRTATLCPLEWPSNYNLLRLWHTPKSFHQYAAQLKQQVQHQHMFTSGRSTAELASRVLFQRPAHFFSFQRLHGFRQFQRPAHYLPETILQQHVRERVFPDRKLRRRAPDNDVALLKLNATNYVAWLQ